ncbi:hypothetical protein AX14_009398, partial [Amanita brunnescens Koide BX004]
MKSSSISMSYEQLPTKLVYPIEIDNTQITDLQPTIPNIQRTNETIFTFHINVRGLNDEDTSITNNDTGGHDSDKENARPATDTNGIILHDSSKHEESSRVDDTGRQCNLGTGTTDSESTERLGKRHEGTPIHTSGNSRHTGESRKDDKQIFRDLSD